MSAGERFFDTNVLLYLLSDDPVRTPAAETLVIGGGVISVQVLNEFASVASRKFRVPWPVINESLETLKSALRVEPLTVRTHEEGLAIAERFQINVYDGLILAAAGLAGCSEVVSEDMQDGLRIANLTVRNPFAA